MDIREFMPNGKQPTSVIKQLRTTFKCPRCQASFPGKYKLDRHLSRKNPCQIIRSSVNESASLHPAIEDFSPDAINECLFCSRHFEGMDSKQVKNHTYYCKRKHGGKQTIKTNDEINNQLGQLQDNVKTLQQQLVMTESVTRGGYHVHNTQNITNHNNYNITINVFPTPNKYGVYPNLAHDLEGCLSLLQDSTTGSYHSPSLTDMLHRVVRNHLGQEQNRYIKCNQNGEYQVIRDKSKGFEKTQPKEVKQVMGQCAYNTIDEVIGAEEMSPGMIPREIMSEQNQGMREMRDSRGFVMTDDFENKFDHIVSEK